MSHDDVFSQGYVGITVCGFHHRLSQHVSCARKGKYKKNFTDGILSPTFMGEVLYEGTLTEVRDLERYFRPRLHIGWNRAIGNEGGSVYKHGLTGAPIKALYYGMRTRNLDNICKEWLGDDGLETFANDMLPIPPQFQLSRKDSTKPFCKDNCEWISRKALVRKMERNASICWEGVNYTYEELAYLADLKPNTLQYRLYRGWSMEESLNLVPHVGRMLVDAEGNKIPYNGRLTDEEIDEIVELRFSGHGIVAIGEAFDIDSSQISRICTKLGVKPNE